MANLFARELLKMVIAQIFQTMECDGIEQSACETMVDILQRYIEELGFLAHSYAEHAGRVECNFNDAELALKDLGVSMKELMLFHSESDEMPFPRAIPHFPMGPSQKRRKVLTSPEALPPHIAVYFPPFPDKHSFVQTPLFIERERDRIKLRSKKNREREQLETNLTKLHSQLDSTNLTNYDNPLSSIVAPVDLSKISEQSQSMESHISTITPTPVERDSPFLSNLFHLNPRRLNSETLEEENTPKPSIEEETKEKEKRQRIESILSLGHDNNTIDQLSFNSAGPIIEGSNANAAPASNTPSTVIQGGENTEVSQLGGQLVGQFGGQLGRDNKPPMPTIPAYSTPMGTYGANPQNPMMPIQQPYYMGPYMTSMGPYMQT